MSRYQPESRGQADCPIPPSLDLKHANASASQRLTGVYTVGLRAHSAALIVARPIDHIGRMGGSSAVMIASAIYGHLAAKWRPGV